MANHPHDVSRRDLLMTGFGAASAALLASGCTTMQAPAQPTLTAEPEALRISPDVDVRCGMIGVGNRGFDVLGKVDKAPGVRVVALCDLDDNRLNHAADSVVDDKPVLFQDYQKMLAMDGLDAVFVETPCYLHAEMAIAVMKSGRHCYCEKPMAINTADLDAMVHVVNETRRVFQIGTQLPYANPWRGSIQTIHDGGIGEPIMIRAHRHSAGDYPRDRQWFRIRKLSGDIKRFL